MMLVPPAGWGSASSPWLWHWALSSSCPSPSSAMRCCSPSPATITSSGSTGLLSMASGTWSSSSPICPLSSSCPLPTSSPSPRALQDPRRGWRCPPLCHPVPSPPINPAPTGHRGQGEQDLGGATAADTAGAGHGLGGLCHHGPRRSQWPFAL